MHDVNEVPFTIELLSSVMTMQ